MRRLFTGEVQKYGFEKGEAKGRAEGKNEIAKKMKDEGLDVELIVKMTGLSKEEVEAL